MFAEMQKVGLGGISSFESGVGEHVICGRLCRLWCRRKAPSRKPWSSLSQPYTAVSTAALLMESICTPGLQNCRDRQHASFSFAT